MQQFRILGLCKIQCFQLLGVWVVLAIFAKETAVFGCLTNALAPPPIAPESCSMAQMDRPVY